MREFEKMTYTGKYPEKLHELMARWSLSEFETALKVVQTYYTNTRAPQKIIHAFETYHQKEVFRVFDVIQDGIDKIRQGVVYYAVDLSSELLEITEKVSTLDIFEGCY